MQASKKYQVALASTLNPDGSKSSDVYDAVSFDLLGGSSCKLVEGFKANK